MSRRAAISISLLAAGVALLVWQVERQPDGWSSVVAGLRTVGWGFAPILLISLIRFTIRSLAWTWLVPGGAPLSAAVAATISGDALGNLTPLGLVASEPAKAVYLRTHVAPAPAFAALTAENFFYSVSVIIYIVIGAIAMLAAFNLPPYVRWSGWAALIAGAVVLPTAGWVAWQKPAVLSGVLGRVPFFRLDALVARVRDFEERTYGSANVDRRHLLRVAALEGSFHLFSFAESYLTLWLLTGRSMPLAALVFDGVNRVVTVVFKMIPGQIGVNQIALAQLATALTLPANIGIVIATVRQVRVLVWATVGVALWLVQARRPDRA